MLAWWCCGAGDFQTPESPKHVVNKAWFCSAFNGNHGQKELNVLAYLALLHPSYGVFLMDST